MRSASFRWACAAVLAVAATQPALADTITSSASSAASQSVGSSSTSIEKSSKSSSGQERTAAGDYRVIDITVAEQRPGLVRVQLQAVADASAEGGLFVWMPQTVAEAAQVTVGVVVAAQARDYGVAFADATSGRAFFLVLDDAVYRELGSQVVVL
jgi:hypothetical protein